MPPFASSSAAAGSSDDRNCDSHLSSSSRSTPTGLLVPVFIWDVGLLWLQLAGLSPPAPQQLAASSSTVSSNSGLSLLHMLLLVQSQGPCLPSLLLLDTMTLLLLQQQPQGAQEEHQPWVECLTVLQNAVTAATVPGACSWQYTAAAVSCLAALYAAAEAAISSSSCGGNSGNDGIASVSISGVARSPWNAGVVQAAVERVCQRAVELKSVASAAMAAEAGSDGSFRLSYRCAATAVHEAALV